MARCGPPVSRACHVCFRFNHSIRPVSSLPSKPYPLRIFATGSDRDDHRKAKGGNPKATLAEKHDVKYTSAERLSHEFRVRASRRSPSQRDRTGATAGNPTEGRMQSRMPLRFYPTVTKKISPSDLLRSPIVPETEDGIITAIEACVRAALDRLQVFKASQAQPTPSKPVSIPHDQYMWLCSILQFQFTKYQLVEYGFRCGLVKSHLMRVKTVDAIELILEKVWNLEKEPELPPDEALKTKNIPITRRERFFMIGEDGGGTLWKWVYSCQARITADLNDCVLRVTATPTNLKKLEWVIQRMFKDTENEKVDLQTLRSLGKFDASYFLPAIARLSSTYLEVDESSKDELGHLSLEISSLGKKRHRVDFARQLIVGSFMRTLETKKAIAYMAEDDLDSLLIQMQDPSLPWWSKRSHWARWTAADALRGHGSNSVPELAENDLNLHFLGSDRPVMSSDAPASMPFSEALRDFSAAGGRENSSSERQFRFSVLYSLPFYRAYQNLNRPGHVLHNADISRCNHSKITGNELIANQSEERAFSPHVFSTHNINSLAILRSGHSGCLSPPGIVHLFTLSFITSPWEYPETFQRIPGVILQAAVDPRTWEVTSIDARLSFGSKVLDIMFPSRDCDLRFHCEEYLSIPSPESIDSITQYIERTTFNPTRNARIIAPPFLQLDLHMEGSPKKSVKYFLRETDLRREVICSFMGQKLVFADIDGGDAWGKRKEVRMHISASELQRPNEAVINAIDRLIQKAQG